MRKVKIFKNSVEWIVRNIPLCTRKTYSITFRIPWIFRYCKEIGLKKGNMNQYAGVTIRVCCSLKTSSREKMLNYTVCTYYNK